MDYKEILKSVLSDVCDVKLQEAIKPYDGFELSFLSAKDIVQRYLKLVKEELGL